MPDGNALFYGDNLDVLASMPDECVDLVYLDPPFNSNRNFNVIFNRHAQGSGGASAQIQAFGDTWTWSYATGEQFDHLVAGGLPPDAATALAAIRQLLGENDASAYMINMAPRLVEMRRVLKPTGSLYLHCDPTMSHYLKVYLDAVFGPENFRNEIIWKRTGAHSDNRQGARHLGRSHDVILRYAADEARAVANPATTPYSPEYIDSHYPYTDPDTGLRYGLDNLTGPGGAAKGNPAYEVMGVTRYWRYSQARMSELIAEGRVIQPRPGAVPRYKRFLDDSAGVQLQDVWADIPPLNSQAAERLGYPTQKPVALMERIIALSTNPGDLVLDPFCGCGTTINAAQNLGRRWVGIDITYIAVDLIVKRLKHVYGESVSFSVAGVPRDVEGARALAHKNRFDFERWAVSLVGAQPNEKQVGDKGRDGLARFPLGPGGQFGQIAVSVKSDKKPGPWMVRELAGTVQTLKADMGILVLLEPATKQMLDAANHAGSYTHPGNGQTFPRVQIITVGEMLAGKRPDKPTTLLPYIAARRTAAAGAQNGLF